MTLLRPVYPRLVPVSIFRFAAQAFDRLSASIRGRPDSAGEALPTGLTSLSVELVAKRLELLHELVPTAASLAFLINPTAPNAETQSSRTQAAAGTLGIKLHILHATSERHLDPAGLAELRASGLMIGNKNFFASHRKELAALALRAGLFNALH